MLRVVNLLRVAFLVRRGPLGFSFSFQIAERFQIASGWDLKSLAIWASVMLVVTMVEAPKGPFCTKNSTAPEAVVFYYRRSFLLSVLFSCLFSLETQAFLSTLRLSDLNATSLVSRYS